jgi:hypothetical protein
MARSLPNLSIVPKTKTKIVSLLVFDRETKGALLFAELDANGNVLGDRDMDGGPLWRLYLRKKLGLQDRPIPDGIKVTIEYES